MIFIFLKKHRKCMEKMCISVGLLCELDQNELSDAFSCAAQKRKKIKLCVTFTLSKISHTNYRIFLIGPHCFFSRILWGLLVAPYWVEALFIPKVGAICFGLYRLSSIGCEITPANTRRSFNIRSIRNGSSHSIFPL